MKAPLGHNIVSFVIRFVPESDGRETRWRGRIRHVQGEQETSFVRFSQALRFIYRQLMAEDSQTTIELDTLFAGFELEE
ncbi:MAG: hypothetical protein ACE5FD_19245 [Anaerolineae bacterium]